MERFIISGSTFLQGDVHIQGAKNAAQKILPATVVFPGEYHISNVPRIQDSIYLLDTLRYLGATVEYIAEHEVYIDTRDMQAREIPPEITGKSTGTFLFAGALLSRFGETKIWHPGGDNIGKRSVTWHLDAFRRLGATVHEEEAYYEVHAERLVGSTIHFARQTVNGTANAILAAVRAEGTTLLDNVALEPEIDNLLDFMEKAGAKVMRAGEKQIRVEGVVGGTSHCRLEIMPDRNDAATFAVAAALCRGPVVLRGIQQAHLWPLLQILEEIGAEMTLFSDNGEQNLSITRTSYKEGGISITSLPYPGFPTDWGPMVQVLMTQLRGESVFHETIFSQRFTHLDELRKMGTRLEYFNPDVPATMYNFDTQANANQFHAVQIFGPTQLYGATVTANDVRAGAALVLGGLVAEGLTSVSGIDQIKRGYESFIERLVLLGATITSDQGETPTC